MAEISIWGKLSLLMNMGLVLEEWRFFSEFLAGVRVFIEKKAQLTLLGTEMDFVESKLSSEFVFNNPNIKGTCGCGESFNIWARRSLHSCTSTAVNPCPTHKDWETECWRGSWARGNPRCRRACVPLIALPTDHLHMYVCEALVYSCSQEGFNTVSVVSVYMLVLDPDTYTNNCLFYWWLM